ncbi:MAG: DUF2914 domain-containing protein [Deltaproteobacteria bacterium]|nr:DUF2914 domain-containing protein [Deltaproteobacteria bacterium]
MRAVRLPSAAKSTGSGHRHPSRSTPPSLVGLAAAFLIAAACAAALACAKAPGKRGGGTSPASDAASSVTVRPIAAVGADGELPPDPALGGRKPPPPMPGARAPLPPAGGADAGAMTGGTPPPPLPGEEAVVPGMAGEQGAIDPTAADGSTTAVGEPGVPEGLIEVPGLDEAPPGAPPAQATSGEPEVFATGEITFRRVVLCKGVKDREPVEPTSTFRREREGQVWVYLDAVNAAEIDQHVSITFEAVDRPGAAAPPVDLKIGTGARYRTWAWATAWRPAGRYRVVIRDAEGRVLARAPFEVVE